MHLQFLNWEGSMKNIKPFIVEGVEKKVNPLIFNSPK